MRPMSWSQAEHTVPAVREVVRHSEGGRSVELKKEATVKRQQKLEAGRKGAERIVSRETSNGNGGR